MGNEVASFDPLQGKTHKVQVVTGLGDFVVTQHALTRAKAVTVVPCYQSLYIVIPVIGGILAYYESVNFIQMAGLALLLWGAVLVSRRLAYEEPGTVPHS